MSIFIAKQCYEYTDNQKNLMIDNLTLDQCKKNKDVLELRIRNIEYAIKEAERMISESTINNEALTFLRKKIADSLQELECLYLIKSDHS